MEIRGIRLRLPSGSILTLGMPSALAKQVTGEDEERLERPIDVLEMRVEESRFWFALADDAGKPEYEFVYEPLPHDAVGKPFDAFLAELAKAGITRPALQKLNTTGAEKVLNMFFAWCNAKQAEVFEREIRAGNMTFEDARESRPEVFDVPEFQSFHAQMFKADKLPKGKKGKRTKYRREVEELYALASRIYRETPGLSWESACYSATEQRPDFVPPSWRADPDGNLKREAARYWDKSRYSQLSYRQNRDR